MDLHVSRWERATTANEAQEERRWCSAGIGCCCSGTSLLFRHSSSGACWQYWLKRPLIRHQLKALLLLLCSHRLLLLLFQHQLLLLPMLLLQYELKRPLLLCQLFRHWLTLISWGRSLCGIKTWLASGRSRLELPTLIRSKIKWGVKLSTAYSCKKYVLSLNVTRATSPPRKTPELFAI